METNRDKSGIIFLEKGQPIDLTQYQGYPRVLEYRYLGIMLNHKFSSMGYAKSIS